MAELGKIERPEVSTFKSNRKLYVVPTLPFEEMAAQYNIDVAKIERFWGEVREKVNYFNSTYGKISTIYIEGIFESDGADNKKGHLGYFEKYGIESNHYKLIKNLLDNGASIKEIDKKDQLEEGKILFDQYSMTFLPIIEKLHRSFYGKDIDFEGWRNHIIKNIQEKQDELSKDVNRIISEMPADSNGLLMITDGRPIDFPEGIDIFQIRPPAFDEMVRILRNKTK
ncbi:MAG: hypothetical protein OIN87_01275 [Candidatus Methanoperedens sp.]|nr:hypothetical protein [Candidatus Methanoperedens sp.]